LAISAYNYYTSFKGWVLLKYPILIDKIMTKENYKKLEELAVTGPYTPTCFPAAIDLVSKRDNISQDTYLRYANSWYDQQENGTNSKKTREIFRVVLKDAGGESRKRILMKRVKTPEECEKLLDKLKIGKFRVILFTHEGQHVVGLIPQGRNWKMTGTHTPLSPETTLTSREVFNYLSGGKGKYNGKKLPNILAISPEKRRREECDR